MSWVDTDGARKWLQASIYQCELEIEQLLSEEDSKP
jgi:hypothetical protein